jgi:hypothetical protein
MEVAKSLEGNWRAELLFVLSQQVELYRIYQSKIVDCDLQLRKHLETFGSKVNLQTQPIGPTPKDKKGSRNAPQFDLRTELYRIQYRHERREARTKGTVKKRAGASGRQSQLGDDARNFC